MTYPNRKSRLLVLAASAVIPLALPFTATAQTAQSPQQQPSDCEAAAPAKAPTDSANGPDSGTKNMGSTGWSGGGLGGSHNDTTAAGPTPGSTTEHPATAKGLDPTKPDAMASRRPC